MDLLNPLNHFFFLSDNCKIIRSPMELLLFTFNYYLFISSLLFYVRFEIQEKLLNYI